MSSQPMRSFRALNERFLTQLAQLETDGSARADAQRTYEELVALLNSNGMQSLAEGRHDEALRFLTIAKDVVTADARSGYDTAAALIESDLQGKLKAVTLNNLGCFYKNTGRPHLALQYCYSALDIEHDMDDGLSMSSTHLNLCSILSAMKKHSDAYDHAQSALQLVEANNPTAGGSACDGQPAGISLRAVAYHNMAVQLEAMNMLQKAVHMLALGSKAARNELGAENAITVSLEKQRARKERVLQDMNTRSKRRESARNAKADWNGNARKPANRGSDAAAAAAEAPASTAADSAARYRSPHRAGSASRAAYRRPGSAREGASHRAASAASTTPRASSARRMRMRPQSAHPTAPVPRAGTHGVTQPTPPSARRARPASANTVGVGSSSHTGSAAGQLHAKARPASARPYQQHQPGEMAAGKYSEYSARGATTSPAAAATADTDTHMDAQFHSELQKLRGKIENEKLVTPEFLQTINDCAQHYYFTNSNAQYRAAPAPT
jgi:tetratricopeptide (TPR) repeat protein